MVGKCFQIDILEVFIVKIVLIPKKQRKIRIKLTRHKLVTFHKILV